MPAEGESSDSQVARRFRGGDRIAGLAACGPGSGESTRAVRLARRQAVGQVTASTGTPVQGGTAYWAEQPLSPPNYIFPLVSGAVLLE